MDVVRSMNTEYSCNVVMATEYSSSQHVDSVAAGVNPLYDGF